MSSGTAGRESGSSSARSRYAQVSRTPDGWRGTEVTVRRRYDPRYRRIHQLLAASAQSVIGLPRVLLGVVPANSEWLTPATNFVMFDDRMVLVEAITAELKVTQPREIQLYRRAFDTLAGRSVTGDRARDLIRKALEGRA
ncbi:Scr1 family TA system antitoxin-like transcriptional regulator [Nocardia sp. NPDC052254]|uniref:Scr1 family TA system antitoxin-like transcriptional regulator n=1 Tax=Nocardia sp. NPDC052254 TaxID=3155681 RepID=UPI00342C8C1F